MQATDRRLSDGGRSVVSPRHEFPPPWMRPRYFRTAVAINQPHHHASGPSRFGRAEAVYYTVCANMFAMGGAVDMVQICSSVCDFCLVILLAVTVARQSIAVVPVLCAGRHMHALLVKVKDCTRICHPLAAHLLEKQWVEGLFGALGLSRQIEFKAALHARGDLSGSDRTHTSHSPFNITLFRNTLSRAARNWRCATSTAFFSLPAVL